MMSKFSDTVKQDTPRLVVMYNGDGGQERFQWGMVGQLPVLTLIGYMTRVQAELAFRTPDECDQVALVIAWDGSARRFDYFVHDDIPVDSLVGMLEMIKAALIGSRVAQQAKDEQIGLYDATGQPIRRR
jgi:hypothetical protein